MRFRIDKLGVVIAALLAYGAFLAPFANFRANRIVPGEPRTILEALPSGLGAALLAFVAVAIVLVLLKTPTLLRLMLGLAAILVLAILISPISWTHYYLLLLVPLSLLIAGGLPLPKQPIWYAALAVIALLVSAPVIVVNTQQALVGELFARILSSHYFLGGCLLLALLLALRWRATEQRVPERTPAPRPQPQRLTTND